MLSLSCNLFLGVVSGGKQRGGGLGQFPLLPKSASPEVAPPSNPPPF